MDEIRLGTDRLKREIGYNPTYFNRMVGEMGPVAACKKLIASSPHRLRRTASQPFG